MNVTNFLAAEFKTGVPLGILMIILCILGVIFLNALIALILFVLSVIKHKISLGDSFKFAWGEFKKWYRSFYKYYLVVLLLLIFQVIFVVYGKKLALNVNLFWRTLIILSPSILMGIYYLILNLSLAKSYYKVLQEGSEFKFTWISAAQFGRILVLTLVFWIFLIFGLIFLGIPSLLLSYLLPLIKYPIIVKDMKLGECIKDIFYLFKENFWDIILFVSISNFILTVFQIQIQLSLIGSLIEKIFLLMVVNPFVTMFLTVFYFKISGESSPKTETKVEK